MKPLRRVPGMLIDVSCAGLFAVLPAQAAPLVPVSPGQNCAAG